MRTGLSIMFICFVFVLTTSCNQGLKDRDGKKYATVVIGDQEWMAENLNTSRFSNGDLIKEVHEDADWIYSGVEEEPAWAYYDNNPESGKRLGKLYNWYAVIDERGICPKGWRVPSNEDWGKLVDYLGGDDQAVDKLKNTEGWPRRGNGSNLSGFSALPAGFREYYGAFLNIGVNAYWWTTTEEDIHKAWHRYIIWTSIYIDNYYYFKRSGLSIRCMRDVEEQEY